MLLHELDEMIYEEIAIFPVFFTIGGGIRYLRNFRKCIDITNARSLRFAKAILLLAKDIRKQTNHDHENAQSNMADEVDTILKDEKSHL
jgi:hypothetical protein